MKCIKCNKTIDDDALFCQFCGKKQVVKKKERARSRAGQGSVTFHKGKQRYYARITSNKERIPLGYFKTEPEAWEAIKKALLDNAGSNYNWTVERCYEEWSRLHYPTISKSAEGSYKNAWKYMDPIKQMKMRDVKSSHLQKCVDHAAELYGRAQCEKIRSLASMLCKFAMKEDLINKNYSEFLELPPTGEEEEGTPFSEEEVAVLWQHTDDDVVKVILTMIYIGFRPSEFFSIEVANVDIEQGFIRGGAKTAAGKNRIVPISSKIEEFIAYFYNTSSSKGRKYLFCNTVGNKMDPNNFRNRYFYKALERIGIDNEDHHLTPYSTRHTFATLCDKANIDDHLVIKMIGHTSHKTTEKFYIHKTEADMKEAIEALA